MLEVAEHIPLYSTDYSKVFRVKRGRSFSNRFQYCLSMVSGWNLSRVNPQQQCCGRVVDESTHAALVYRCSGLENMAFVR